MFGVPATTPYDWNFSIFGYPVRVAPWFWAAALIFGRNSVNYPSVNGGEPVGSLGILAFAAAMFLSILIHELGHAVAFRYFGIQSEIVLYHFGGLAIPTGNRIGSSASHNPWHQVAISAAGPGMQIAAAIGLGLLLRFFGVAAASDTLQMLGIRGGQPLGNDFGFYFLVHFYWVSIIWALFNLLPVYPLDGGQIARNVLLIFTGNKGIVYSLMLSTAVGALLAVWGLRTDQLYLAMLFGSLAYGSFQAMQAYQAGPRRW